MTFFNQGKKKRKANIYFVIGKTASQNNDEQELGS